MTTAKKKTKRQGPITEGKTRLRGRIKELEATVARLEEQDLRIELKDALEEQQELRDDIASAYARGRRDAFEKAVEHLREAANEAERASGQRLDGDRSIVRDTLVPAGFKLQADVLRRYANGIESIASSEAASF